MVPPENRLALREADGGLDDLLIRLRRSDAEADWEDLIRRKGAYIRSICRRELAGRTSEDDAVQESLLAVRRHLPRYQPGTEGEAHARIRAIVARVARNMASSETARYRREQKVTSRKSVTTCLKALQSGDDLSDRVRRIMAGLPEGQRRVLELRYVHGLTPRETADRLGLTSLSVRVALSRALFALRRRLAKAGMPVSLGVLAACLGQSQPACAAIVSAGLGDPARHTATTGTLRRSAQSGRRIGRARAGRAIQEAGRLNLPIVAGSLVCSLAALGLSLDLNPKSRAPAARSGYLEPRVPDVSRAAANIEWIGRQEESGRLPPPAVTAATIASGPILLFADAFDDGRLGSAWSVKGGQWAESNQVLAQTSNAGGGPKKAIVSASGVDFGPNHTIAAKVRVDSWVDGDYARAGVSLFTNTSDGHGYNLVFHNNHSTVQFLDDYVTWGPSYAFHWTNGTWYWFKLRMDNGTLYGKVWRDGTAEPGGWPYRWARSGRTGYPALNGGSSAGGSYATASFDDLRVTDNRDEAPPLLTREEGPDEAAGHSEHGT